MPIYQRHPQVKVLCQAHNRVIDSAVPVRVELTHNFPHHARAFHMPLIRPEPHFAHHINDAPLHRLQTVPSIGQGACINHRIGVFQEGSAHLLGNINMSNFFRYRFGGGRRRFFPWRTGRHSFRGRACPFFFQVWLVEGIRCRHGCRKQIRLTGFIRLFAHPNIKTKNGALVRFGSRI